MGCSSVTAYTGSPPRSTGLGDGLFFRTRALERQVGISAEVEADSVRQ